MSEDEDQRTEEPTSKRLQDAQSKGQVASSQEVKTWIIFVFSCFLLIFAAEDIAGNIAQALSDYIANVGNISAETTGYQAPLLDLAFEVFASVGIVLLTFVIAALVANRMQNNFIFTLEKLKPDISNLSPLKGAKKIFSSNNLVEFIKAIAKMTIVGIVVFLVVYPQRSRLDTVMFLDMLDIGALILELVTQMFIAVTIVLTIIAAIDYSWQSYQHTKSLRMTKQEVKDEHKQSDGDPKIKARLRQIRMGRMAKRLASVIPEADVIITNPTHFAVALKYEHGAMDVPVVVAKGVDSLALRIRELAEEHGVPIVENPPLARTLHASVEIDEEIHPDHYEAVASVISYIMKLARAGIKSKPKQKEDLTIDLA